MRSRGLLLLIAVGLLVASCGGEESGSTAVAPFHAIPDDGVAVSGTAACVFGSGSEGLMVECELDMSDPRVSGAEVHDGFTFFAEGSGGQGVGGGGSLHHQCGGHLGW